VASNLNISNTIYSKILKAVIKSFFIMTPNHFEEDDNLLLFGLPQIEKRT